MEMKVTKKDLQESLQIVKPGLATKELIEQSTSFAFIDGKVVTYNDEISISHPVPGLKGLTGAVLAETLYKFLNKIKKNELIIECEKNEILVKSAKTTAGLSLKQEIKLPLDEELTSRGKWYTLPEQFTQALSFTMTICTNDLSRPVLTCVNIDNNGFVTGSDGFRIAEFDIKEKLPIETFLLPATAAYEVVKLQPTKIAEGKGWVHFKTEEGTILSCRVFEEKYPDAARFFVFPEEYTELILPQSVPEALERVMVFSKRSHILDEIVDIEVSAGTLQLYATAELESGWITEKMKMKYSGEPFGFKITPYLLKEILKVTQSCQISDKKLKFSGSNWRYVTMLRG